jgi:hypothetical protein
LPLQVLLQSEHGAVLSSPVDKAQPLFEPAVIPPIKCRCSSKKMRSIGRRLITEPAIEERGLDYVGNRQGAV